MKLLVFDNYDSFTYNIVQLLREAGIDQITVARNDQIALEKIADFDKIVLSPGPGRPENAGICVDTVRELRGEVPILGVCLGHQAICVAYGATVTYAPRLMHGKPSEASVDTDSEIFSGLPDRTTVGRYHSLAVDPDTLPADLSVTAVTADREVMAVEDRRRKVFGLQFHPESILTPCGQRMVANFMGVRM